MNLKKNSPSARNSGPNRISPTLGLLHPIHRVGSIKDAFVKRSVSEESFFDEGQPLVREAPQPLSFPCSFPLNLIGGKTYTSRLF